MKFTDSGEVVVRGMVESKSDEIATIRLSVTDTGPGIPLEQQRSLFESFSQGDTSTTRRHGGTGLGLAISKRLVELMGGVIGMQSAPGQGSEFWATLPLPVRSAAPVANSASLESLGDLNVLVVDDNETNRLILERMLRSWNMVPTTASSAAEALTILSAAYDSGGSFDVALLDFHMPETDGMQLAHAIGSIERFSAIRCALLTSSGDQIAATDVQAQLTKPVRQSTLFDCIARLVGAGRIAPQAPAPPAEHKLPRRDGRRTLLVEDNVVNQMVARRMLESLGYSVDVAVNGREALRSLERYVYDAVLMDCQMPEMDGYEATEHLRAGGSKNKATPVIAMTASAMEGDADRCLAAGMDDYLAKPVRIEELQRTLECWISRDEAQPSTPARARPANSARILDVGVLQAIRDLTMPDHSMFNDTLLLFLDTAAGNVAALHHAVDRYDLDRIDRLTHTMKGSAGTIGAVGFADRCAQMMTAARNGATQSELSQLFSDVREEFGRTERLLRIEINSH